MEVDTQATRRAFGRKGLTVDTSRVKDTPQNEWLARLAPRDGGDGQAIAFWRPTHGSLVAQGYQPPPRLDDFHMAPVAFDHRGPFVAQGAAQMSPDSNFRVPAQLQEDIVRGLDAAGVPATWTRHLLWFPAPAGRCSNPLSGPSRPLLHASPADVLEVGAKTPRCGPATSQLLSPRR